MRACCAGRANVVSLLLARGADPTEVSGASWTALIEAAYGAERPGSDHVAVIRMLLDDGRILVDDRTEAGATALAWACSHGHTERVRVLLVEGRAHHRLADCRGIKPWILARFAGHEDCVRLIDWYEGELHRAYQLSKARAVVEDAECINRAAQKVAAKTRAEWLSARRGVAPVYLAHALARDAT